MEYDKREFIKNIYTSRDCAARLIVQHGIEVDEILAEDLSAPGTDQRYGLNIIARPTSEIIQRIEKIQREFRSIEPHQYFYPPGDLHLTLLEVCFAESLGKVQQTASTVLAKFRPHLLELDSFPILEQPVIGYDQKGCALNFVPRDGSLSSLRMKLSDQIELAGIRIKTRYSPKSAHVTFLRFIRSLTTSENRLIDFMNQEMVGGNIVWPISEVFITWGLNWYGMRSRIKVEGPFDL